MSGEEDRPETDVRAAQAKVDPETLALRAQPVRAIRFKRGAIVGIAALGSAGLVATAWIALRPAALHLTAQADDQTPPSRPPICWVRFPAAMLTCRNSVPPCRAIWAGQSSTTSGQWRRKLPEGTLLAPIRPRLPNVIAEPRS